MPSFIIVGYVWPNLGGGAFLTAPHPWAALKKPIWIGLNCIGWKLGTMSNFGKTHEKKNGRPKISFFPSGFSFTTIYKSQDSSGRGRAFLLLHTITSTCYTDTKLRTLKFTSLVFLDIAQDWRLGQFLTSSRAANLPKIICGPRSKRLKSVPKWYFLDPSQTCLFSLQTHNEVSFSSTCEAINFTNLHLHPTIQDFL